LVLFRLTNKLRTLRLPVIQAKSGTLTFSPPSRWTSFLQQDYDTFTGNAALPHVAD
jgi:hypothetical protein